MTYIAISTVTIFVILLIILFVQNSRLKKDLQKLKDNEKILKTNQQNLHTTLSLLTSNLTKASSNIEKQYTSIKQIEMTIISKLSPLLDKNQVVDELRKRIKEADITVSQLRSTILQMTEALRRMQKKEKEEDKTTVKVNNRKKKQQQTTT